MVVCSSSFWLFNQTCSASIQGISQLLNCLPLQKAAAGWEYRTRHDALVFCVRFQRQPTGNGSHSPLLADTHFQIILSKTGIDVLRIVCGMCSSCTRKFDFAEVLQQPGIENRFANRNCPSLSTAVSNQQSSSKRSKSIDTEKMSTTFNYYWSWILRIRWLITSQRGGEGGEPSGRGG